MAEITVLMPVYNSAKTLPEAMESILNQSFTDFEFLIIDDGSTDNSVEIIQGYKDPRIRLVRNEKNIKLIKTLNRGFDLAQGKWIARMDADDISFKDRLRVQREFLLSHPEFAACGTNAIVISETGNPLRKTRKPVKDFESWTWIPSPVLHPTLMMRADVLKENHFDEAALHCEDYELWLRLTSQKMKMTNLPQPLLYYRVHSQSVTNQNRNLQLENSFLIFQKYFPHSRIQREEYFSLIGVGPKKMSFLKRIQLVKKINKSVSASMILYCAKRSLS